MATCHLCPPGDNRVGDTAIVDHIRVMHPNQFEPVEECPDGQIVIIDADLEVTS